MNDDNIKNIVKFKNTEKSIEILNKYKHIFNEKVTKDSIDISTYLRFILEFVERDDYEYLLSQQENFVLINLLLKYNKYYSTCTYIYENDPEKDEENLSNFLNDFQTIVSESNETTKKENMISLVIHPYLYGISYLNFPKTKYLKKFCKIFNKILPEINPTPNILVPKSKRIKLGVVGFTINCDARERFVIHSVYRDRAEILKQLDGAIFEKFFIVLKQHDEEFIKKSEHGFKLKELYQSFDHIVSINSYTLDVIHQLMNLKLDILLYPDIGMNPFTNVMGNYRIAPVQINTWGHSVTSGIQNMDYYISSKYYELPDLKQAQTFYSEKLIAQDSLCTFYRPYNIEKFKTRAELGIPENAEVLFCIQNVKKFNLEFFDLLKRVIEQKPEIMILLKKDILKLDKMEFVFKYILGDDYKEKNKKNIIFVDYCDTYTYHCLIHNSTIVLDTYPFGGCNSSLEAFSLGKIVITRPSEFLYGRFTLGFYNKMGITDPIVYDYEEYYNKIMLYLNNHEERNRIETEIKEKKDCLFYDNDSVIEWRDMLIDLHKKHTNPSYEGIRHPSNNEIYLNPLEFLDSNRFDIIFKYIYVKYTMIYKNFNNWTEELYKQHIAVINGGYQHPMDSKMAKNSLSDFSKSYKYLINAFIKKSYNEEPLNVKYIKNIVNLIKGAHRLACCIYFKKNVLIKNNTQARFTCFRPEFFTNRANYTNLLPKPGKEVINSIKPEYLNMAILEYLNLKRDNTRIVFYLKHYDVNDEAKVVNEINSKVKEMNALMELYGIHLVYTTDLLLSEIGLINCIREFNYDASNIDSIVEGVVSKINFANPNTRVRLVASIVESDVDTIKLINKKRTKKDLKQVEMHKDICPLMDKLNVMLNNPIVIEVTKESNNKIVACCLFNKNTLELFNTKEIKITEGTKHLLEEYKTKIETMKSTDNYCLTGEFITSLFKGKRISNLEYIHNEKKINSKNTNNNTNTQKDNIVSDNESVSAYPYDLKDIIYNPEHHFYIRGLKCCLPQIVIKTNVNKITF